MTKYFKEFFNKPFFKTYWDGRLAGWQACENHFFIKVKETGDQELYQKILDLLQ